MHGRYVQIHMYPPESARGGWRLLWQELAMQLLGPVGSKVAAPKMGWGWRESWDGVAGDLSQMHR